MTTTTLSDPPRAFPWPPVLVLTAGTLWTVTAELLPAGLLLGIADDTGVSPGAVGYLVTAWGLVIALLSLPLTRLTRRLDRRRVLALSLVVTGAATVLTALAPTFATLVVARTIAAAGHGLFWSQVAVTGTSLAPDEHRARVVAWIVAGPTVGTVAAVPVLTALGEHLTWRLPFALVGLLTLATALVVHLILPVLAPPPAESGARRDRSAPVVAAAAVVGAVLLVAHAAAYTFVAPIVTDGGLSQDTVGGALLVFGAAGIAGLLAAPALLRRFPYRAVPATGLALAVGLAAVHATTGGWLIGAIAAWGLVMGALPAVFQASILGFASERFRPTAGAVMVVAFNLGVAAGAALGGEAYAAVGVGPLPLLAAGLAALAAVVGAAILSRHRAWMRRLD